MGSAHGKEGRRAFLLELCLHRVLTGTGFRGWAWAAAGAAVAAVVNVGPGSGRSWSLLRCDQPGTSPEKQLRCWLSLKGTGLSPSLSSGHSLLPAVCVSGNILQKNHFGWQQNSSLIERETK